MPLPTGEHRRELIDGDSASNDFPEVIDASKMEA